MTTLKENIRITTTVFTITLFIKTIYFDYFCLAVIHSTVSRGKENCSVGACCGAVDRVTIASSSPSQPPHWNASIHILLRSKAAVELYVLPDTSTSSIPPLAPAATTKRGGGGTTLYEGSTTFHLLNPNSRRAYVHNANVGRSNAIWESTAMTMTPLSGVVARRKRAASGRYWRATADPNRCTTPNDSAGPDPDGRQRHRRIVLRLIAPLPPVGMQREAHGQWISGVREVAE